ncbi:hypothetical protein AQUCO_00500559v1 [Aquilegia coerulea]|uniref:Uncharacterized protein n=1 Tax=Aquilegia coerulea TaxID=218851 RepID=A0A2G5ESH7_AQUCA|nr:hypothetical protein AQUCO_00500559v1 [Aquilegia coerulea]
MRRHEDVNNFQSLAFSCQVLGQGLFGFSSCYFYCDSILWRWIYFSVFGFGNGECLTRDFIMFFQDL